MLAGKCGSTLRQKKHLLQLRDAYHNILDDLDDNKELTFALMQHACARDNGDPLYGIFIAASCNPRSSHSQYTRSSTEHLQYRTVTSARLLGQNYRNRNYSKVCNYAYIFFSPSKQCLPDRLVARPHDLRPCARQPRGCHHNRATTAPRRVPLPPSPTSNTCVRVPMGPSRTTSTRVRVPRTGVQMTTFATTSITMVSSLRRFSKGMASQTPTGTTLHLSTHSTWPPQNSGPAR
jgi:hypothetical protein